MLLNIPWCTAQTLPRISLPRVSGAPRGAVLIQVSFCPLPPHVTAQDGNSLSLPSRFDLGEIFKGKPCDIRTRK